ncbi:uncharacterized protein BCR38DRAFT_350722, partial [Pseudomassariella vexata]
TDQWLAFGIHEPKKDLKYPLNSNISSQDGYLDIGQVTKLVTKLFNGKLKPTIKSQAIPTVQESAVIKIVGLNYQDVILDNNKDVLIEFLACR